MNRLFSRARDDRGFSMILVLGVGFAVLIFALVAASVAVNTVRSSGQHIVFGQNLDAAESGVDQLVARLQQTNGTYSYCPTTGHVTTCDIPSADWVSGFPNAAAEKSWASTTLQQLAADQPSLLQKTTSGQYLAIRPAHAQTVYSMSWVPSYSNAKRSRLFKNEYIFSTYHPANAILTNGDISCCPSYDVNDAPGITAAVGIHTNGNLGGVPGNNGNNSLVIQASATGTCSSPCVAHTPVQSIPVIDPRVLYNSQSPLYSANWYDLCPDNTFRHPNTAANAVPCTGTIIQSGGTFRGWSGPGTWGTSGGNYPGVYYVYHGSISTKGPTISGATTMVTEATANDACPKTDGDITIKQTTWTNGPFIPGLMAMAGGSWYQTTQTTVSSGAVVTQGSVNQHTSAHDYMQGLLIGQDLCGETNNLQGSLLYYDGGEDLPIAPLIRTTLELELTN